ncbi:hypothetical protein SDC9_212464 [bioreactor metagenome]|uniref:Uncharacterized protein n=1 Tax=bioreactor metagenome TaxID=1076179 RepID=A0A645JM11_9ZZZZ
MKIRVKTPPTKGITTNNTTERINVSQGTVTLLTPSKNLTIGMKATKMIKSLVATWTTVYAGFPFVSWLQTNTIAVHGAAPRRMAPAKYSVANSGVMKFLKTTKKKKAEMAYMVKGFISQFTIQVT